MKETNKKTKIRTHDDFVKEVASEFISMLEAGTAPFQTRWNAGVVGQLHHNISTGKEYQGINQLYLDIKAMKNDYKDTRWLTYKQAQELGGQVRKGENSTKVEYWDWYYRKCEKDEKGNIVEEANSKKRVLPRVFFANVFNGEQIDGLEPYLEPPEIIPNFDLDAKGDELLKNSGVSIYYRGSQALYSPSADAIKLPPVGAFEDKEGYYATALHELAHATGHKSRLARQFGVRGTKEYAREELRAEIGSYMVAKSSGLPHQPQNQASYVAGWLRGLKEDPREIYRACRDASLIKQWILEPEKRQELEKRCQEKRQDQRQVTSKRAEKMPEAVAMGRRLEVSKMTKEEDILFAMQSVGLKPSFKDIILDGKFHRVPTIDDKGDKKSGSYMGHSDGVANAIITNFKTGERMHWIYSGDKLSKNELETLRKEGEARKAERDREQQQKQAQAAKTAYGLWNNAKPATNDHPYLKRKAIGNHDNLIRVSKEGQLFIPIHSHKGKLQSLQIIDKEGNKRFLQNGKIEGGMLQLESNKTAEPIVIAESYATAKSIHEATGLNTVIAFSAHRLKEVAGIINKQNPEAQLIIASDNDKNNVGLNKALDAGKKTNSAVILPTFSRTEKEQGLSDFNDLAKARGLKEVKKQFDKLLQPHKTKERELA